MTHYYCTLVRYHIPTSLCKAIISRNVFIFIKIPPKSACNQGNFIVCNCRGTLQFPFLISCDNLALQKSIEGNFLGKLFYIHSQYAKAALFKVTSSFQREVKKCVSTPICMDVIFKEWKWSRFWLKAAAKCEGRGGRQLFLKVKNTNFFVVWYTKIAMDFYRRHTMFLWAMLQFLKSYTFCISLCTEHVVLK